jgi:hypothetical protein
VVKNKDINAAFLNIPVVDWLLLLLAFVNIPRCRRIVVFNNNVPPTKLDLLLEFRIPNNVDFGLKKMEWTIEDDDNNGRKVGIENV